MGTGKWEGELGIKEEKNKQEAANYGKRNSGGEALQGIQSGMIFIEVHYAVFNGKAIPQEHLIIEKFIPEAHKVHKVS